MKYSVIVCEEPKLGLDLSTLVKIAIDIQEDLVHKKLFLTGVFNDPSELLKRIIQEKISYGIYVLATSVFSGKRGLELAKKIRMVDKCAQLIFVTDDISQVYLAFESKVKLLDCINSKQINSMVQSRLNDALLVAVKCQDLRSKTKHEVFYYRSGSCSYAENFDNIICITTTKKPHHLCLETLNSKYEITGSLQKIAKNYPTLRRISQSCLVNESNIYLIDLEMRKILFVNGKIEYYSKRATKVIKKILKHRLENKLYD